MNKLIFAMVLALIAASAFATPDNAQLVAFVDGRLKAWQPTLEERRFDEIGWVTSISEAERLAAKNKRPIFYFTHDGRMAIGRC